MESWKGFCMTVCLVSLITAPLCSLIPTRLRRQTELVMRLFLLLCLLAPLSQISLPDWGALRVGTEVPVRSVDLDGLLQQEIEARISQALSEKLEENGIFAEEIRIDITVAGDQIGIDAVSVALRVQDGQLSGRAQALAEELLGTEVLVTAGREVQ